MLLFVCVLSVLFYTSKCNSSTPTCPTWTYPSPPNNQCVCGATLYSIICDSDTLTVYLRVRNVCIFYSEELQTTLAGTCPYGYWGKLPKKVSKIEEESTQFCHHLHRTGRLCGECKENYTLPVYSYYLGCVKCESYKNGWIKFIAAAFLPLTLVYIVIIMFRISATSSALNGFIMVNQLVAIPPVIRQLYSSDLVTNPHNVHVLTSYIMAMSAFWNLDFFRSFYGTICLYPNLRYQHILLLEYAIGVYPLFLIFLTYIMVKLHDNFTIVVWLWSPFHRCLAVFRRQWNIQSYLVHALATFVVLSYVKILNTSFEFLIPSHVFNMEAQSINKAYWYYDGSVDMTSKGYLPYLMLALFMLLTFNVLPLLSLAFYPFRFFQRFLDFCLSQRCKLALKIYMDAFHGCYEDTAHDYRYFAALYLAVRFLNLLIVSVFNYRLYFVAASLLLTFVLALVAKFQPYKCKRSNRVDIVMLLAIITGYTLASMHSIDNLFPKWLYTIILCTAILVVHCYSHFLILASVFSKVIWCFKRIKPSLNGEINMEDEALLSHAEADYRSCH